MTGYNSYTDKDLVDLLVKDDDAAFREIYKRYNTLLYLYAYRKLQDKEESKDIVQEVFIALWDNRGNFLLKTYLAGYLYKSVLNRVLNVFRHKGITQKYADIQKLEIDVDSTETDFLIREKEISALIASEIDNMPPRMKEIYQLKKQGYLSTKEIAAQLNLSELTVSTQLKRALKHLRSRLGLIIFLLYIINSQGFK